MGDPLAEYQRKRDPARTSEPVPTGPPPAGENDTFVVQQHHARRLHRDQCVLVGPHWRTPPYFP